MNGDGVSQGQHLEQATGVFPGVSRRREVGPQEHCVHVQALTSCLYQLAQHLEGGVTAPMFVR